MRSSAGCPRAGPALAIVSAVVSFARALDMEVVAEGVETQAHVDALRDLGCEYGQGFFFHRPVEPERITALLGSCRSRRFAGVSLHLAEFCRFPPLLS